MNADLAAIQSAVERGEYQYTLHAVRRSILRHISRAEVESAIAAGEVIEDYPNDKYGPSCLIFGIADTSRPLHIQVSYPPIVVITMYDPNPEEWENYRVRKKPDASPDTP
jgi:hypothetical protein